MSDFKAIVHQIRFPLGLRWNLQRSSRPLSVFKRPSKGWEGKGWGGGGKGREKEDDGRGGEGRKRLAPVGEAGSASNVDHDPNPRFFKSILNLPLRFLDSQT